MMKNISRYLVIIPILLGTMVFALPIASASTLGATIEGKGSGDPYEVVATKVTGKTDQTPLVVIGAIINVILGFLGLILVAFMIYGGFLWMTDNGDEKQVTNAKNVIKNSVIGATIVVLAFVISNFVITTLSGSVIQ